MRNRGMAAVAVAVAAVVGMSLVAGCGQRYGAPEPYDSLAAVPERLDGARIVVGDPDAELTVDLYEDPRCPYCEEFEVTGGGPALEEAVLRREARTRYTMASFLDDRLGGSGSKKAVNALRAALEANRFAEYHEVLYDNQPEEEDDGFTDARLLELARQVDGLRGPAFDSAVRTMKYRAFVTASERAYEAAGGEEAGQGPGTPTAVINGVPIPEAIGSVYYDPRPFTEVLRLIRKSPEEWQQYGAYVS